MDASISGQLRGPLLAFLDERGLRASACRRRLATWDAEKQVALFDALTCVEMIRRECLDPLLALEISRHINLSHLGVMGYLCLSCETLWEVFSRSSRFYHLVWTGIRVELSVTPYEITAKWSVDSEFPEPLLDAVHVLYSIGIAGDIRLIRQLVGEQFAPRQVILPAPKPADSSAWEEFFKCPVKFESVTAALTISISDLLLPVRHDGDLLRKSVERQIEAQLQHIVRNDDFLQAVQQLIVRALHEGKPSIERVAADLSMSRATLHRRLSASGSNFRELLDDTRYNLAQVYLRDLSLSLADIAWLLAFSEQSAFNRSFRRRAGVSPGQFRSTIL